MSAKLCALFVVSVFATANASAGERSPVQFHQPGDSGGVPLVPINTDAAPVPRLKIAGSIEAVLGLAVAAVSSVLYVNAPDAAHSDLSGIEYASGAALTVAGSALVIDGVRRIVKGAGNNNTASGTRFAAGPTSVQVNF